MALIDLESDTEVGPAPSGEAHLTARPRQRGRMPNFDSDVSSNFTSVSKQNESEPENPISRSDSLKREDGRRSGEGAIERCGTAVFDLFRVMLHPQLTEC